MNISWTPEMEAQLTKLWAANISCSAIATLIGEGLTKNAIIGKAGRMNLGKRGGGPRKAKPRRLPKPKIQRVPKETRRQPRILVIPELPVLEAMAEPWEPLPGSSPISLVDLNDMVCRWPVGGDDRTPGTGFCGCAVAAGRVYCPEHYATSIGKGTPSERGAIKVAKLAVHFERAA